MMNKIYILLLLLIRVAKFLILSRYRLFYITTLIFWVSIVLKMIHFTILFYFFEPNPLFSLAMSMSNDPLLIQGSLPPLIDESSYNPYQGVESLTEEDAFVLYDVITKDYTILSESFKTNLDTIHSQINGTMISSMSESFNNLNNFITNFQVLRNKLHSGAMQFGNDDYDIFIKYLFNILANPSPNFFYQQVYLGFTPNDYNFIRIIRTLWLLSDSLIKKTHLVSDINNILFTCKNYQRDGKKDLDENIEELLDGIQDLYNNLNIKINVHSYYSWI